MPANRGTAFTKIFSMKKAVFATAFAKVLVIKMIIFVKSSVFIMLFLMKGVIVIGGSHGINSLSVVLSIFYVHMDKKV